MSDICLALFTRKSAFCCILPLVFFFVVCTKATVRNLKQELHEIIQSIVYLTVHPTVTHFSFFFSRLIFISLAAYPTPHNIINRCLVLLLLALVHRIHMAKLKAYETTCEIIQHYGGRSR
jgi:hypothetical protein